ncbi:T9SS type A sorting domain-containing protein [Lacibacter sp. H375]|uniref:T9SS type A sorting domain-containing protein n=1 Tax=Lacibacter sp. H375 TaxID=3133424 RepID=UPI0030BFF96B
MKTFLLSFALAFTFVIGSKSTSAQCTVSDIFVQNISVVGGTATSCTVKFDVTFNIADNNGNKFIFIHAWLQEDYPNYFKCENGQSTLGGSVAAPKFSDLAKAFINIGLDNTGESPVVLTSYPPDGSVSLTTIDRASKVVLADGSANITLYGVVATSPVACTTPVVIVADLWSSQAASAQRAHCVNCGIRSSAGFLSAFGFVNCFANSYTGSLTNNTSTAISGYYRVYADVNGDGYFTVGTDTLIQSSTNFTLAGSGSIALTGAVPVENSSQSLFVLVTQTTGAATNASRLFLFPATVCGPLPVTFLSFDVNRINRTDVLVKWETATEENNRGFVLQRKTGNGAWQQVAFIPSKAIGGNSSSTTSYSFTDMNNSKGLTQYRIQQIDFDGKTNISGTRVVRGEGQDDKMIIYPNPSTNGRVMIVFSENKLVRDIILVDMYGKLVKQWRGVEDNSLEIDKLTSGMYLLKVISRESGEQTSTKIVVSNY